MPIRLGIIGLSASPSAWATSAHLVPLRSSPSLSSQYTVTALATSSPKSAKAAAKAHGIPEEKAYHSAEDLANDPDVDMVVVSVKVPLHKELTQKVLEAGKPVLVEWALGKDLEEAEELAEMSKRVGVKTAVSLQSRLHPVMRKAKEIVDSGALGRILNTTLVVSTSIFENLPVRNDLLNDPSSGVNNISIATSHILDPLCFLFSSEFKTLNATATVSSPTIQFTNPDGTKTEPVKRNLTDSISVQGVLHNGVAVSYASMCTTEATPDNMSWIISGEKGALKLEGKSAFLAFAQPTLYQSVQSDTEIEQYTKISRKGTKWEEVEIEQAAFGGIGELYAAFAAGSKDYVDFDGAVTRHKMVEAIYRSVEKGTRESY